MGVHDAPAWLVPAFTRNVVEAGGTAPVEDVRRTADDLLERWTRPERHFHNLKHLVDVLARVDELDEETHHPELVRLAAWFHGAVFDSAERKAYANKGGEDEAASAVLAREQLLALGVPEKHAQRVADLVSALVRHAPHPTDIDCAVLCDADLAMLATEPQRYKSYLNDVRAEYAHLPVEDYLRARVRILHKLLARPSLFVSPLAQPWEEPARQNVSAELQRLEKEIAKLEAANAEAAKAETANAEATKAEAAKAETAKAETAQSESERGERTQTHGTQNEAAQAGHDASERVPGAGTCGPGRAAPLDHPPAARD